MMSKLGSIQDPQQIDQIDKQNKEKVNKFHALKRCMFF